MKNCHVALTLGVLGWSIIGVTIDAGRNFSPAPSDVITIQVVGTNGEGGPAIPLVSKDAFEVRVDHTRVPIRYLIEAPPPTIIVLADMSVSYRGTQFPFPALEALNQGFFSRVAPPDRVEVGTISNIVSLGDRFYSDRAGLRASATRLFQVPEERRHGPSPLWDGIDTAVTALEQESGRKAIIFLSDGESTGNVRGLATVVGHAVTADVAISVVPVFVRQAAVKPMLRSLAEATGGRYVDGLSSGITRQFTDAAAAALTRILEDLHRTYTLGITPAAFDDQDHLLEVTSSVPEIHVAARRGFHARQ